jgi:hypothetical protein
MDAHVHARRFFFLKKYRQKYPLLPSLQPSEAGEMHFEEEIRSRGPKDHEAQESFPRRHYPDRVRGYLLSPAPSGAPLFQLFPLNHFLRRTANAAGFCPETDAKIDSQKPEKTRVNRGCRPSYRVPIFFLKIAAIFPSWAIQYERNFYSPHLGCIAIYQLPALRGEIGPNAKEEAALVTPKQRRRQSVARFNPQPEGLGPIFPISASLLARRYPISVARRSLISKKLAPSAD